jgi:hypothetical protein
MAKKKLDETAIVEAVEGLDFLVVDIEGHGFKVQQCTAEDAIGVIVGAHLTLEEAEAQIAQLEAANEQND